MKGSFACASSAKRRPSSASSELAAACREQNRSTSATKLLQARISAPLGNGLDPRKKRDRLPALDLRLIFLADGAGEARFEALEPAIGVGKTRSGVVHVLADQAKVVAEPIELAAQTR